MKEWWKTPSEDYKKTQHRSQDLSTQTNARKDEIEKIVEDEKREKAN